jgi:hypothetical protein
LLQIAEDIWPWSPPRANELFDQGLALARSDPPNSSLSVAEAAKAYAVNHSQDNRTQALMCEAIDLLPFAGANRRMTLQELSRGLRYASDEIIREVFFYLVSRAAWMAASDLSGRLLREDIAEILQIAALLEPDRKTLKSRLEQSLTRSSAITRSLFEYPIR